MNLNCIGYKLAVMVDLACNFIIKVFILPPETNLY